MNRSLLVAIAIAGSLVLLGGAFAFEHIGGMPPCKLCIWQRWAHFGAIAAGLAAIALGRTRAFAVLGGLAVLFGAGVAGYHAGVEQQWWTGPETCAALPPAAMSAEERLDELLQTPVIRCDDIPGSLAGVSMAGWNGLISLVLAWIWLQAVLARRGSEMSSAS
ncbi:MAG: disulfide bond formation protein B [Rhodobacteraceae bacterium]|nr:disulfide bond formation protein B [Paracoccaceae bacterium]